MPSLAPTRLSLNGRVILCLMVTVWTAGALLHIRTTRARADREQNRVTQKVSPGARAIAPFVPAGTTYHWSPPVASLADWTIPTNWTPSRLTPAADDILVIDPGFTPTLINVPSQTIGALVVTANTDAKLQAGANANTLTISGSGLQIDSGSSMTLDGINTLVISVASGSLASITGNLVFQGGAHRLLGSETATDTAGISFQSGSIFTTSTGFTGNPFGAGIGGDGADQSVRFRDGSAAFFNVGNSPFGTSGADVCSFTFGSAETFSSSSAFSYDGRTYGSLTLDGAQTYAGGSSSNGVTVGGDLTIATGSTFSLSTTSGADLTLWGDLTVDGTLNPSGRTVKFQSSTSPALGKATQTIKTAATFDGVNITKASGSLKLAGNVTINGALIFAGTSSAVDVLELNQKTLNLNGTSSDTSGSSANGLKGDATGATLNIGGTGALGTLKFVSGAQSLKSLTVNRTGSGTLTLGTNLTIGNASVGSFTLTNGVVDVGANTLSLASFPTITRTNGYVIGNLQKTFASTGNFTFTVGTANGYSPVDANVTAGTGNSLTVKAIQGKHPNIPLPNALLRYWTITNSGSVTANLTFNYLAGDVVGTEANYKIFKYNGSFTQFAPSSPIDTVNHAATLNGVNSFSDWTLADPTLTVNTTVDADDGSCTAVGTGNGCTLREAINAANSFSDPNTINFSFAGGDPGCSGGVCTISLGTALPSLATDMTITGTGASSLTVKRNSAAQFRIFSVASTVTISALTIANGNSPDRGGGVDNGGTLTMTNCNILGSTAPSGGGGVSNFGGSLTLNGCNIGGTLAGQANAANPGNGGGILNLGGTLTMTGGSIVGNSGSGFVVSLGTATLNGVAITNNTSSAEGGGGGTSPFGTANIINCLIAGNTAGTDGGGFFNNGGNLTVVNSTVSGNSAARSGGGLIYPSGPFNSGTITLTNDTITNNRSDSDNSGGELGGGISRVAGTVRLKNTIVAGNFRGTGSTADDINGTVDTTNSAFNLIGTGGSGGLTSANNNQVGVANPLLGTLANNGGPTMTHALLPGSPAIDAGDNCVLTNTCSPALASAVTTDQRSTGFNRSSDGNGDGVAAVDIGAFEVQSILVTNTNDSGPGSLRQAIADANGNGGTDAINFQAGLNGTINLSTALPVISTSMLINGPGANQITISGNNSVRVFNLLVSSPGVVNISGLTVANGSGGSGSGVLNNFTGAVNLSNLVMTGNSGSAVYNANSGPIIIRDSVFTNNSGGNGGGVFNTFSGTITIINSSFSQNSASSAGGAVANQNLGTVNIVNCTLTQNSAAASGAIDNNGTLTVINSTLTGNVANIGVGGAISSADGNLTLTNSTVTQNSGVGGGIYSIRGSSKLKNTIVAGNTSDSSTNGPDLKGDFTSQGYNVVGKSDGSTGFTNGVNNDQVGTAAAPVNALLAALANNGGATMTHALLPGSPAINAGSNANLPADTFDLNGNGNTAETIPFDQRGFARITNGTVDIGAFESRGFSISASSGTPQSTTILTSFALPLVATVTSAFGEPVAGGVVTFTAPDPNAGPSATFPGSASTATATINGGGAATSPTLTANTSAGSYNVVASTGSGPPTASFALTNKASTLTQVSSSVNPSDQGENVTFTATVSTAGGTPSGTVQFKDGGTNLGAPQALDSSFPPKATISTTSLTPGTHTITAEYSGDTNFNPSSGTLSGGQVVRSLPMLSINDVSMTEGDSGTKNFVFTVTLSAASHLQVKVDFATADGTATTADLDYQSNLGTLTFNAGDTTKTITVLVNGDQKFEPDETFFVNLSNPFNATISDSQGQGTIVNDDAQGGIISFSQSNYVVNENGGSVTITVNRGGDTSGAASVDYSTPDDSEVASVPPCSQTDGLARPRCDFTTAVGTFQFAAGETSKTFAVLISQDSFVEGSEGLQLTLSNLTGGAVFGTNSTAVLTINDDDASPSTINPIDDPENFVRQHYHDFLNREPDASGLDFWKHQITDCGGDPQCIEVKRINVSGAFYLSIEFQGTGYLVERMYKAAYGDVTGTSNFGGAHQVQVPAVRFNEFLRDTQKIGQGVIVGAPDWENQLETNKNSFAADFVKRSRFSTAYPTSLSPTEFVNQLFAKTGITPTPAERQSAIDEFGGASDTTNLAARGRALRKVAENPAFNQAEFNRAFVLMQYFGYLRRNPDAEASTDYTGYDFWLTKLNQFGGNFQNAEMVKAFISSDEYRHRFGL